MKNNSLAMIALIALVGAPASLIGYIDPKTCPPQNSGFTTCQQAADQHVWLFWILAAFGVATFVGSFVSHKIAARNKSKSPNTNL
ncbi:MAG: hypothetical protein RLZ28_1285 [Actinomycetota bacterium]|jgi:predicted MFS family arabinose efflux permease